MSVTTEIVKTEQLSDGAIGITVRANGDPKTDAVLTIYSVANMTPDAISAIIDKHHQLVAARSLAMDNAKAQLAGLKQLSVTHKETDLEDLLASQQPQAPTVTPAREIEVPAVVPVPPTPVQAPNLAPGITLAPVQPQPNLKAPSTKKG
jgi:hypothetical protein